MLNTLRNFFTPPVYKEDEEITRIANVLYRILIATYVLMPTAAIVVLLNPASGRFYLPIALAITVLVTVFLAIARRGYIRSVSMALITAFLLLSTVVELFAKGETRPISILSGAVIVAGGLLLGPRGSYITAILYGIKHIAVLLLINSRVIVIQNASPTPTPLVDGITTIIGYMMIAVVFGLASNSIYFALTRLRQSESELTDSNQRLQELTQNLEKRIEERTVELEKSNILTDRRARQFEAITRVSRTINSAQNLQELLPRISEVVSEQFDFYHVGIFLIDASNKFATLVAANSPGGKKMMARSHQLKVGEQGIVGYATGSGNPRIALDVGVDSAYFNNPELPDTHSEMALPLKIGGNVIGALDVQSTERNAFTNDDVEVLSTLADQVSLAIQNARLFDQTQKSLSEAETIYRQNSRDSWSQLPKELKLTGYRYNATGATPLSEAEPLNQIETEVDQSSQKNSKRREISVPIILRGETIGTLSVQVPKSERVSGDQIDLIKAVAERVALSAENARLFEETTTRATRERLVSDITNKIRSTNDPQEMMQTAMAELQRVLGATRVEIIPQKNIPSPDR
jgi:GAF domain-containing protein